jgi:hypothetical protein
MRSHEMECAVTGCTGEALPRADRCRLHYLKELLREQRIAKRKRESRGAWFDHNDAGSEVDDDVGDDE